MARENSVTFRLHFISGSRTFLVHKYEVAYEIGDRCKYTDCLFSYLLHASINEIPKHQRHPLHFGNWMSAAEVEDLGSILGQCIRVSAEDKVAWEGGFYHSSSGLPA